MAKNKYEKNLSKVQDMLDGTYAGKIQSGYVGEDIHANREVGERYFDSDGNEWENKGKNYRVKISRLPSVGLFDKVCKDCDKPCIKKFDKHTYNRMDRCYNCQVQFEEDLKWDKKNKIGKNNNKWFFWVKLQQLKRWESIDRDMEQLVEANYQENKKNPFDMSVANAIANANVSMEMKKNT